MMNLHGAWTKEHSGRATYELNRNGVKNQVIAKAGKTCCVRELPCFRKYTKS